MIDFSDQAAALICTLVVDSDLPDSAGLRLGTDDHTHSLAMHLAAEPSPTRRCMRNWNRSPPSSSPTDQRPNRAQRP